MTDALPALITSDDTHDQEGAAHIATYLQAHDGPSRETSNLVSAVENVKYISEINSSDDAEAYERAHKLRRLVGLTLRAVLPDPTNYMRARCNAEALFAVVEYKARHGHHLSYDTAVLGFEAAFEATPRIARTLMLHDRLAAHYRYVTSSKEAMSEMRLIGAVAARDVFRDHLKHPLLFVLEPVFEGRQLHKRTRNLSKNQLYQSNEAKI
jgi:hypothetical protein